MLFRVAYTPKLCMLTQLKKNQKSFEPFMCLDWMMLLQLLSAVCLCSLALVQITHCLNPTFCYFMTVFFKVACVHLLPNNTCRQSDHAAQSLPDLSSQLCKKVYIINVEREKSAVSQNSSAEPAAFFLLNLKKKKKRKKSFIKRFQHCGDFKTQCNLREVTAHEWPHAIWAEVEFSTIINDYSQCQCN